MGVLKCSCGMAFRPMISGETLKVDLEEKRNEIRRILEKTIIAYHVKDENVNNLRDRQREKAIDYLLTEIMKGPIVGGTLADNNSICHDYGSFIWTALQKAILVRDPICRICNEKPSKEVHHIRPRHLNGKDHPRNLIGLCLDCHDEIHKQIDYGIQNVLEKSLKSQLPKFKTIEEFEKGES